MLNAEECRRTSDELTRNLSVSGLTPAEVAADLEYSPRRLASTLAVDGPSDPVDVWQLRDYLEQAVRDAGQTPVPFTVLTERSRSSAVSWFHLRSAPHHDFTAARGV